MIDLHTHILPGLDDGPQTLAGSLEIARAAIADGTTTVAATPHVHARYPTSPAAMEQALADVRAALAEAELPLEVLPGGEVALDRLEMLTPEDLVRFGLGGNRHLLLVETPYAGWPLGFVSHVVALRDQGITPVVAHPERNAEVQASDVGLRALVSAGALVQVTAASLDGRLGRRSKAAARALLDAKLVHIVASDAHTPDVRAIGLSSVARAIGDQRLAGWLTEEVPAALLADEALPPRPTATKRSFWPRRRQRSAPEVTAPAQPRQLDTARRRMALAHLRRADPVLAHMIDARPEFDARAWLRELPAMDSFGVLCFQVIGQQLSLPATRSMLGRLQELFGGQLPSPAQLLAADPEDIRRAGLSRRKVQTLRTLAGEFVDGGLSEQKLQAMPDDEIEALLIAVPGVGPWTVQGFLIIALRREDVVLPGDLALRKAIRTAYQLDHLPSQHEVLTIAEPWRPYRSLATSYLFASVYNAQRLDGK